MKHTLRDDQRGLAHVLAIGLVVILIASTGFVGYRVYNTKQNSPDSTDQSFSVRHNGKVSSSLDKDFVLPFNKTAELKDGNETIKFRFTEYRPASNQQCPELCRGMFPEVDAELEYAGKTYKGTGQVGDGSGFDWSYDQNGAYVLIPYSIELVRSNFPGSGTLKISKLEFSKITLGKEFTLHDGGVAALTPGKTGVYVGFGICGIDTHCIRSIDFYVDDKYIEIYGLTNVSGGGGVNQYEAIKGGSVEGGGLRLRLVDSDNTSFVTFVLEKSK